MPYARNAWLAHTFSSDQSKQRAFPGYVLIRTSQLLKRQVRTYKLNGIFREFPNRPISDYSNSRIFNSGICNVTQIVCDSSTTSYRTHDGTCNNVRRPLMGSTFSAFRRELPPDYSDGISEIRHSAVSPSDQLPNPRRLSNVFFSGKVKGDGRVDGLTAMFVHWAMFVFTDMVHIGSDQLIQRDEHVPLPCCESEHPECRSITVAENDPLYGGYVACLDYPRTMVATNSQCDLGQREQANQATSFLDASQLYGSTKERTDSLRTFRDGEIYLAFLSRVLQN
jgi:hypothetical protein